MNDDQTIPGFDEIDQNATLNWEDRAALKPALTDKAPEHTAAEADPAVEAHIAAIDFDLEDLIATARESFESVGLTAVIHPDGLELWKISGTMKEFVVALSTENILKAAANKVK